MAYKNKLGLLGIPLIQELRPQKMGFFSSGKIDEFVYISNVLEEWQLKRKTIADFVQDETHHEALLRDLTYLKKKAELELITEDKKPAEDQIRELILRRKTFIKIAESEIARLHGWKPTPKEETPISFREFNAKGICFLSNSGSRKVATGGTLYIFEEGDFIIRQDMIEANQKTELERVTITKANAGQPIKLSFDISGTSRLALYEQRTKREESRPL